MSQFEFRGEVPTSLTILYQDDWLVAVEKPSGLMVHRSWLAAYDEVFVMTMLRDQLGQYVYPLHRLDRQTDGVLLFALSSEAAKAFNQGFEKHQTNKAYLAVCRGFAPEFAEVDHALVEEHDKIADKDSKPREAVEAITHFQRLATTELNIPVGRYQTARYSLMKACPITGRKHQIRKHLNHLRHPLVVDAKHGDRFHNQMLRERFDCHRLLLRAMSISLYHPYLQREITIEAGLTAEWLDWLVVFGWQEMQTEIIESMRLPTVNCP